MSGTHNRTGLRGLGLSLDESGRTPTPILRTLWSDEDGQKQVS